MSEIFLCWCLCFTLWKHLFKRFKCLFNFIQLGWFIWNLISGQSRLWRTYLIYDLKLSAAVTSDALTNGSGICRFSAWRLFMVFHFCCDVVAQPLPPPWQSVTVEEEHQPVDTDLLSGVTDGECLFYSLFLGEKKKGRSTASVVTTLHYCREVKVNLLKTDMMCLNSTWFKCQIYTPQMCSVGKTYAAIQSSYELHTIIYLTNRQDLSSDFFHSCWCNKVRSLNVIGGTVRDTTLKKILSPPKRCLGNCLDLGHQQLMMWCNAI